MNDIRLLGDEHTFKEHSQQILNHWNHIRKDRVPDSHWIHKAIEEFLFKQ